MEYSKETAAYKEEMIKALEALVKYNSVNEAARDKMPFGKANAECLDTALNIAKDLGFETKNCDNYCGWAEIGEGEEIIGIAAHLDIVPAGDGWDTDPFTLTQKGDTLYGRGVSDDKGAVIASLYAMKQLRDSGIKLNKRIRLIMGCNEETGSRCMQYYSQNEEPISCGFTPDGSFPGIFGEKGMCALTAYSKNTSIISMNGGFVSNAVCNSCVTEIPKNAVDIIPLREYLQGSKLQGFSLNETGDSIIITAKGTAAHASTPWLGVNAAGVTMEALKAAGMKDDFVDFYLSHIGNDCDGSGLGCKFADKFGALTLNNGIVKMQNGKISCTIDIRFPVTLKREEFLDMIKAHLEDSRGSIEVNSIVEPLFYPPESDLVKALHEAYITVTGDTQSKPQVIGGGTYAKSLKGIIAFGCEFPNSDNHIHDANECLPISQLLLQTDIYIEAIKNLLEI